MCVYGQGLLICTFVGKKKTYFFLRTHTLFMLCPDVNDIHLYVSVSLNCMKFEYAVRG